MVALAGLSLTGCEKEQLVRTKSCGEATATNDDHPKTEAFEELLRTYSNRGLPGITLLIRDSSGVWTGAAGRADIEQDVAMKPCHISKVASITKPFIGTLVMMLAEEDQLDLDQQITTYIKEDVSDVANADRATVRQLLNHTSGIYDVVSDDPFYLAVLNDPTHEWEAEELLTYVEDDAPYAELGSEVQYANTNYLLLSLVIEGATGRSHYQLLQEKILQPLNLFNTVYHPQQSLPDQTARGYYDLYNNGNIADLTNYNTGNGNGYNGIYSNVRDLQTFIEALLRDKKLVSKQSLDQMQQFRKEDSSRSIGLGLMQDFPDQHEASYGLGHGGKDLAYSGDLWYFPEEDLTFVTLVNYGLNGESDLKRVYKQYRDRAIQLLRQ